MDNIVIVIDTSNYIKEYAEKAPFKAVMFPPLCDGSIWIKSVVTGKEYELYSNQILEMLEINEIEELLNLNKY